jgi:hypothetical protein
VCWRVLLVHVDDAAFTFDLSFRASFKVSEKVIDPFSLIAVSIGTGHPPVRAFGFQVFDDIIVPKYLLLRRALWTVEDKCG